MNEIMETVKKYLSEAAADTVLKLVGALLLLFIGFKLIKCLCKGIARSKGFLKLETGTSRMVLRVLSWGLKSLLVLTIAAMLGVPMTSIVALLGSAGLAVGLALQGSLSNLAGGFLILVFRPYKIGDVIKTPGGEMGRVDDIGVFYTTVTSFDNRRIVVPNGSISNAELVNYSSHDTRRVDLTFNVAYSSDVNKVISVILGAAAADPMVLSDPAPFCRLSGYLDSSMSFVLRAWCAADDYWQVYFDLNEGMKAEFDKNGIEIPFPQLDVHTVKKTDEI